MSKTQEPHEYLEIDVKEATNPIIQKINIKNIKEYNWIIIIIFFLNLLFIIANFILFIQ